MQSLCTKNWLPGMSKNFRMFHSLLVCVLAVNKWKCLPKVFIKLNRKSVSFCLGIAYTSSAAPSVRLLFASPPGVNLQTSDFYFSSESETLEWKTVRFFAFHSNYKRPETNETTPQCDENRRTGNFFFLDPITLPHAFGKNFCCVLESQLTALPKAVSYAWVRYV